MFQIEKNVPIPPRREYKTKYPWDEMDVGDSFYVPNTKSGSIACGVYRASKRFEGKKFISRSEAGGIRVWRVK